MKLAAFSVMFILVLILVVVTIVLPACSLHAPDPQASMTETRSGETMWPDDETQSVIRRVGGDVEASVESREDGFRSGSSRILTPLPQGYPDPTPPGAIDLKHYPLVRRAAIGGSMSPDWGMNFAFFPLFNHIKRREIAMTSPVEMNYEGLADGQATRPTAWTMSFLYRSSDLAPAGVDPKDKRVRIEDIDPVTVISVGMRGDYKIDRVNEGLSTLRNWLARQNQWEEAGEPRALFYNGPEVRASDKWLEVQIPVRATDR